LIDLPEQRIAAADGYADVGLLDYIQLIGGFTMDYPKKEGRA
jgi:hypothetical protein